MSILCQKNEVTYLGIEGYFLHSLPKRMRVTIQPDGTGSSMSVFSINPIGSYSSATQSGIPEGEHRGDTSDKLTYNPCSAHGVLRPLR
jgi:hypothetical protein